MRTNVEERPSIEHFKCVVREMKEKIVRGTDDDLRQAYPLARTLKMELLECFSPECGALTVDLGDGDGITLSQLEERAIEVMAFASEMCWSEERFVDDGSRYFTTDFFSDGPLGGGAQGKVVKGHLQRPEKYSEEYLDQERRKYYDAYNARPDVQKRFEAEKREVDAMIHRTLVEIPECKKQLKLEQERAVEADFMRFYNAYPDLSETHPNVDLIGSARDAFHDVCMKGESAIDGHEKVDVEEILQELSFHLSSQAWQEAEALLPFPAYFLRRIWLDNDCPSDNKDYVLMADRWELYRPGRVVEIPSPTPSDEGDKEETAVSVIGFRPVERRVEADRY